MPRTIPDYVRAFQLTKVSTAAVTYHFRPTVEGWALATVNDETGEMTILSDWGNWNYRWNVKSLGSVGAEALPMSLTAFIADRSDCDYLAGKLTSYEERHVFDVYKTIASMRRTLCERRAEQARAWIDYYQGDDPEDRWDIAGDAPHWADTVDVWYAGRSEKWPLTKSLARTIYAELGALRGRNDNADDFIRGFLEIDGHEWITDHPWDGSIQYEPSCAYMQLLHGILPALSAACGDRIRSMPPPATEMPREATARAE